MHNKNVNCNIRMRLYLNCYHYNETCIMYSPVNISGKIKVKKVRSASPSDLH